LLISGQGFHWSSVCRPGWIAAAEAVKSWAGSATHDRARDGQRTLAHASRAWAKHEAQETGYPAARLLSQVEAIIANKTVFGHKQPGQYWLRLMLEKDAIPVRLMAPSEAAEGKPLPLVLALHGAGGQREHLFRSLWQRRCGSGNVTIAAGCWSRHAPGFFSDMPAAQIVDAVDRLYPVDRKRVYIVGHSMGAMQAGGRRGTIPIVGPASRRLAAADTCLTARRFATFPFSSASVVKTLSCRV